MEKQLRVAIIGFGRSGKWIHGNYFASETAKDHFKVVAVVDAIETRRKQASDMFNCEVFADYHEILNRRDDIDLVVNSTFSHYHHPVALDFLNHGFNVVTEKPFAVHEEQCQELIDAAEKNHVMLCVFQQSHFAPYYRRIREIVDSGVLGYIPEIKLQFSGFGRRWDWQTVQRFGGGCVRNTGPHPFEQALDLLGADVMPTVFSKLDIVNSCGDAEDFAKVLLLAPGKPIIDIEISGCNRYNDFTYIIQGEYGSLKATTSEMQYCYYDPKKVPEMKLHTESLMDNNGDPMYCREDLPWEYFEEKFVGDAFNAAPHLYYTNIYNHLTNGEELVIKPARIKQMIALMDEIHRQNPLPEKI